MKPATISPVDAWAAARRAVEGGESYPEVSKAYGIKVAALRTRSFREKWDTPQRRVKQRGEAALGESARIPAKKRAFASDSEIIAVDDEALAPHRASLLSAAKEGPEPFRKALQDVARVALAESVATIPLPRTIGEWKSMVDILEKAEKMGADSSKAGFIRHPTSLSGQAIEAEVIRPGEADGFAI